MKYFYFAIVLTLFGCNSELTNQEFDSEETETDSPEISSGGEYDSGDHNSGCGNMTSYKKVEILGEKFILEIPTMCQPIYLDRGDPEPKQKKNLEFEIYQQVGTET